MLAAELLQVIVNKAFHDGSLTSPLPQAHPDFPIVQYADDTIMIMEADAQQLLYLKNLPDQFADSTGVIVNYGKSQMIPINMTNSRAESLAQRFGCQLGSMPFTYLGLPMGTTKPRIEDMSPTMSRVERRLSSCSSLLSISGRVQLVNSMISPIVTYAMCTIKLHKGVIENVERAMKQYVWRGNDRSRTGGNLAAWPLLRRPKDKGGLGIINLFLQNDTLLLKHLHKFYSKQNIRWVNLIWTTYYVDKVPHAAREIGSFWWKDVLRLNNLYRGVAQCSIGDGSTVLFWDDL